MPLLPDNTKLTDNYLATLLSFHDHVFKLKKNSAGEVEFVFSEGEIASKLKITTEKVQGQNLETIFGQSKAEELLKYCLQAFHGKQIHFQTLLKGSSYKIKLKPLKSSNNTNTDEIIGVSEKTGPKPQPEPIQTHDIPGNIDIINSIGEGIGIVDKDEKFLFANSAAEKIFDVTKGNLVGRSLKEFSSRREYAKIRLQTLNRIQHTKSEYEIQITSQNGINKTLLVTTTSNFDANKNFIHSTGVFRDISNQADLKLQLTKLKTMLDNSPIPAFLFNRNAQFSYLNTAACNNLGYSFAELSALTVFDIAPERNKENWADVWDNIRKQKLITYESVMIRKDSSIFPVEVTL